MLNNPHKNIFYYYRGPSKKEEDEIIYDKQIEDNTTKALINCFDYCSNGLLNHFTNYFSLNFKYKEKPQYILQISKLDSRPDALIKSPCNAIYIESKISASVSINQLINHKKNLTEADTLLLITNNVSDKKISEELGIKYIKWSELHNCFKEFKTINKNESFLIEQFLEYLEVIGVSDFTGFNSDDFDFFVSRISDYKPIVKDKLEKFSEAVYNSLNNEIKSKYADKHTGIIPKDCEVIWYGIRKDQSKQDIFKHCNFTIEINSESLSFQTVIRDGKYLDNKPIGVLYKKIRNNFDDFQNLLRGLNKGYFFRISKRMPRSGEKIMPGNERWELLSKISLEIVKDETINYILMMLKNIQYPGLHFSLNIFRGDPILQEPEKLISSGKRVIEDQYQILKFLES